MTPFLPPAGFPSRPAPAPTRRWRALAAALGVLGLLGACQNRPPADPMAEAAATGERPVAMTGGGTLLGGKIAASVSVSRGFDRGNNRGAKGGAGADGAGGAGGSGGHGGKRSRHAADLDASAGGLEEENFAGFESATESEQKEMYASMVRMAQARRAAGSPMPPVSIHLRLENKTDAPQDVEVLEASSELGNFAVRPGHLVIAPHEVGTFDPMVSQLGVTSDDIPLTLTLRLGQERDSQVITVRTLFTARSLKG